MRRLIVKTLGLLCILYSCNLTHDTINQGVVVNLSEIRVGSFRPLIGVSDDTVAGFIDAGVFCKSKKSY
jgi:hypothetical protein